MTPEPGTRAARPRYPGGPEFAGSVDEAERLRRKLAIARWERDRWQRRCRFARERAARLELRLAWIEGYIGFRIEYRLRGIWRRWRRWRWQAWRRLGLALDLLFYWIALLRMRPARCADCHANVTPRRKPQEWYMLRDEIWNSVAGDEILCVGCVERRLRRRLVPSDFSDAPCNTLDELDPWRSERLRARLVGDRT